MKFKLTTALFFTFLGIFSVNSQSVNNVIWETPSYEMNFRGTTGSNKSPGEKSTPILYSGFDFTSAGDYYNSQSSLSVISFTLTKPGFVNIKIYDEKGNTIDELARSSFGKGAHLVKCNRTKVKVGSY